MTVRIKQETISECVKCVAAMATGTTLEEARREMASHSDGASDDFDFALYCIKRRLLPGGIPFEFADKKAGGLIDFSMVMAAPAYVVVKTPRIEGRTHAIYWDGESLYDPNPHAPDNPRLVNYTVLAWWILLPLDGDAYEQMMDKIRRYHGSDTEED